MAPLTAISRYRSRIDIVTLAGRPDLAPKMWELADVWPEFMLHDPIADLYYSNVTDLWADWTLLAVDDSNVVARAFCLPFAMGADIDRPVLPDNGWDGVIRWSFLDGLVQRPPTTVSALEISIDPGHRGSGLAQEMISAMMDLVATRGFDRLVVPVRPSRKHVEPNMSMLEYVARVRPDGLPDDPWLRLHVRMGGRIVKVCSTAMTIPGTLAEWREWTGLPFEATGPVIVPGALVPVNADVTHDHAVYVEPNVWVEHVVGI